MSFLGIDLGTSGVRALLVNAAGEPIGSAERPLTVSRPHPGWSEQDPADWIVALDGAVDDLRETCAAFAYLEGIAVAGHMHGATLIDDRGAPLRPCILWNDTRSHLEAARLDGLPGHRERSGNIVFPGFTAPKLAWVQTHEPETFRRTARVLLPASFLTHYLTGRFVMDMSDASGTAWLDVSARRWSDELLSAGQMRPDQMPRLSEGCEAVANLRAELADRWGVSREVVVAGGAGDNAAAACGIGALSEGQGFVSLGTSGVLLVARNACRPRPETAIHTFCHAIPDRWIQMGVILSATDSLNWLSRLCGTPPVTLTAALGQRLSEPGDLRFFPYLSGERTPHNDAAIRGAFTGLTPDAGQVALTHAVLEGVAFALRDSAEALKTAGVSPGELFAIGGGAASDYWLRLLATVLNVTLLRARDAELGAALGAARLARIAATGLAADNATMPPPMTCDRIEPDERLIGRYDTAYHAFRDAYAGLRAIQ